MRNIYSNIGCKLKDAIHLVYEVAREGSADIRAVYDGGIVLVIRLHVSSEAELLAADLPPGTAAICPDRGLIRLFAPPVFPVTADAEGEYLHLPRVMSETDLAGGVHALHRNDLCRKGLLA